jgi:squalene-associated FAD-dependent desaturase
MMSGAAGAAPTVAVVGGGLAGLAAAVALASAECRVELFEARRWLGGRAASFHDPKTNELVDHCQHVSMGCCTNLADFCRRTAIDASFRRDRTLHFIGLDGRCYPLAASKWLPAPLHLAHGFWGLKYLSIGERIGIARAMWRLMRMRGADDERLPTVGRWLREQGQSERAIEWFWGVVLISALGEDLNRASLSAARKVIVDGFLSAREAYTVEVPQAPLSTLYGERLQEWFAGHGVALHVNTPIRQVKLEGQPAVVLADGVTRRFDNVVVALPWSKVRDVLSDEIVAAWPLVVTLGSIEAAPITGVHLWFDRPVTELPHAVLVGRLSQWIFKRDQQGDGAHEGHYYQVVISASRNLAGRDRQQIVAEVCAELAAIWPAVGEAQLLHARVVTEHAAVFSVRPGLDHSRPRQQTPIAGLFVAGDWTATGWPSTMESAVRSGYLAAEAVLRSLGREQRFLAPDLPRGWLARALIAD